MIVTLQAGKSDSCLSSQPKTCCSLVSTSFTDLVVGLPLIIKTRVCPARISDNVRSYNRPLKPSNTRDVWPINSNFDIIFDIFDETIKLPAFPSESSIEMSSILVSG